MTIEQIQEMWHHLMKLSLKASTMDDVYDSIQRHCNEHGIDFHSLEIDY